MGNMKTALKTLKKPKKLGMLGVTGKHGQPITTNLTLSSTEIWYLEELIKSHIELKLWAFAKGYL